jgi:hypothetical protein
MEISGNYRDKWIETQLPTTNMGESKQADRVFQIDDYRASDIAGIGRGDERSRLENFVKSKLSK